MYLVFIFNINTTTINVNATPISVDFATEVTDLPKESDSESPKGETLPELKLRSWTENEADLFAELVTGPVDGGPLVGREELAGTFS